MDLSLLKTLKDMMATAKEFQPVIEYFFDHFGEDPEFIKQGERVDSAFLEAVLARVGKELFGSKCAVGNVLLTRLPEQGFIHGACTLSGHLANLFYFEEIHTGLMAVLTSPTGDDTKFVRFAGRPLHGNPVPSAN